VEKTVQNIYLNLKWKIPCAHQILLNFLVQGFILSHSVHKLARYDCWVLGIFITAPRVRSSTADPPSKPTKSRSFRRYFTVSGTARRSWCDVCSICSPDKDSSVIGATVQTVCGAAQCHTVHSSIMSSKYRQPLTVIYIEDEDITSSRNKDDRQSRVHWWDSHSHCHSTEHFNPAIVHKSVASTRSVPQTKSMIRAETYQSKAVREKANSDHSATMRCVHCALHTQLSSAVWKYSDWLMTYQLNCAGYMWNKTLKLFQNNFISRVTTSETEMKLGLVRPPKLFQNHFSNIKHAGKYSRAAIRFWNNFKQVSMCWNKIISVRCWQKA